LADLCDQKSYLPGADSLLESQPFPTQLLHHS
jgi:hypothetical protein